MGEDGLVSKTHPRLPVLSTVITMANKLSYLRLFLFILATSDLITAAKHCKTPLLPRARLSASSEISKDRSANHANLHGK